MRNLKRALSLALAAIMVLGLMVVGASAASYEDFTDKGEIKNSEAVATMVSLGVISGKDNGSYDPTGSLTRAEACTLIARMLGGGKDPVLGSNIKSNFKDTQGHWAENYIAYCANLGIIAGVGNGNFKPDDTLTGSAAAKMVLCALGYKPEFEGIGGANWELATNTLATKVKLYDGLDNLNPSETISRDNVAQLIYNGVQAQEVEYRNLQGDYSGTLYATEKGTMLSNRFGVVKVEGVVVANEVFGIEGRTATLAGKTMLADCNGYTSNGVTYSYNGVYPISMSNDLVGQRVVIYVKFNNALSPNASQSTVLGTPIVSSKTTVVETTAKLKNADAVKDALKGTGISFTGDATTNVYTFSADTTVSSAVKANGQTTAPGVRQRFIDNDGDGKVDVLMREVKGLSKISAYNTKDEKLTLSGIGSVDFEDVVGYEGMAKDDYVLVIKYADTYYIEKAQTVEGTVTAYNSGNSKITLGDGAYAVSAAKDYTNDLDGSALSNLAGMVNNDYVLYLDGNGNVVSAKVVKAAIGNYAVITASTGTVSTGFSTAKVKLAMADGTTGTYDVNLLASAKKWNSTTNGQSTDALKEKEMADVLDGTGLSGVLVSYTINEDGTVTIGNPKYIRSADFGDDSGTLVNGIGGSTPANVLYSSDATYTVNGTPVVMDNSTLFFIENGNGTISVVKGLQSLPSKGVAPVGNSVSVIYDKTGSNNVVTALYAKISGTYASSATYAYISSDYTKSVVGGEDIYTYNVVLTDGTASTIKVKGDSSLVKGTVYAYSVDNNGYAVIDTADTNRVANVFVYETGNNTVSVWDADNYPVSGGTTYSIAKDAKVWNVEDTDSIYDTTLAKGSVFSFIFNDDGEIKTAFVSDVRDSVNASSMTAAVTGVSITTANAGSETVTYTAAANQKVAVYVDGVLKQAATAGTGSAQTVSGLTISTTSVVKLVITQTDMVTRTMTYVNNVMQ